ncbi:MAG: RNA methyltransferase [Lentisphaeria bacterium]
MSVFLYGINPAFETIRAHRRSLVKLYLAKGGENNPRIKKLKTVADQHELKNEFVSRADLFDLCQTRENQGAVIEVGDFPYMPFAEMIQANVPRMILLDNIEDPHNVGAILRTAETLGWNYVLLPRRGVPLVLPSVVKASAGASEFQNIAVNCAGNQYVKIALEEGYTVVSLDGSGKISLEDIAAKHIEKLLLVVGGENSGVSHFIQMESTYVAAIHQSGKINSLNASVAAALALYLLA